VLAAPRPASADSGQLNYLTRRGFTEAADALPPEARSFSGDLAQALDAMGAAALPWMEKSLTMKITLFDGTENYGSAYAALSEWVHGSLDLYKARAAGGLPPRSLTPLRAQPELILLLYPMLVHSYLKLLHRGRGEAAAALLEAHGGAYQAQHAHELHALSALRDAAHVENSELAKRWMSNKFAVSLTRYAYELLIRFLLGRGRDGALTIALINEHFAVVPSEVGAEGAGRAGGAEAEVLTDKEAATNALRELPWGLLDSSLLVRAARAQAQEPEASRGPPFPLLSVCESLLSKGAAPPQPSPLPVLPPAAVRESLAELRQRVRLSASAQPGAPSPASAPQLPSALAYTLLHGAERVCCAALSASGSALAAGLADSAIRLWDCEKLSRDRAAQPAKPPGGGATVTLQGHAGPVYGLDFCCADACLLSCSADASLRLWSVQLAMQLSVFTAHAHPVWAVAAAPLGHYFASGSFDRTVRIWALDSPHPRRVLAGHSADVDAVAWHPTCNYVASGSADRTVRLWDVAGAVCVRVLAAHRAPPRTLAFAPDGRRLASGADDGSLVVWDLGGARVLAAAPPQEPQPQQAQPPQQQPAQQQHFALNALAWSVEGGMLASGGEDGTVRVWDCAAPAARGAAGKGGSSSPQLRLVSEMHAHEGSQLQTLRFSLRNLLFTAWSR